MMNKPIHRPLLGVAGIFIGLALFALSPAQAIENPPKLKTDQEYLDATGKKHALDVKDHMAVLGFILNSLPDRVKVYPTENYYYFSFIANGLNYEGNIRLDASDRDQGFVSFAFVEQPQLWRHVDEDNYHHLSASDGIKLEKLADLSYKLTYKDRSVIFDLNDLSKVKPPEGMLNTNEVYIGPSFDESGMAFYLVFNKDAKVFHFIYNEKESFPERFDTMKFSDRITVGRRTSFAFYKDQQKDRQILIGVQAANTWVNNYFDGPFDQLPDNFIQGDSLRDAIVSILPEYKDKLDRFGAMPGGEERYAITPYMYFEAVDDLKQVEDCVSSKERHADQYYACFNVSQPDDAVEGENQPGDAATEPAPDAKVPPNGSPAPAQKP